MTRPRRQSRTWRSAAVLSAVLALLLPGAAAAQGYSSSGTSTLGGGSTFSSASTFGAGSSTSFGTGAASSLGAGATGSTAAFSSGSTGSSAGFGTSRTSGTFGGVAAFARSSAKNVESVFSPAPGLKEPQFFDAPRKEGAAAAAGSYAPVTSLDSMQRDRLKQALERAIGLPYRFGGRDPGTGLDPAGLVWYVFRAVDQELPDDPVALERVGERIARTRVVTRSGLRRGNQGLLTGDIVFLRGRSRLTGEVVVRPMIYYGDGQAVFPSAKTGEVVMQDIRPHTAALAFVQRVLK